MEWFDFLITKPIIWIIQFCYKIVPNYVVALIIFTIIVKLLLFPFSIWSQVQSVKMAKMKPELEDIKAYHSDDWRLLLKEQKKIYKKERYSGFVTLLPLVLQIPIIIGVIRGLGQANILANLPGLNMWWFWALSAISAFALCYVQNLCNVLAKEMGFLAKWGMAIFLTAFSLYFTITSGVGFGIYWIVGNLIAIVIQLLCNLIYNPKKYITYKILPKPKKNKLLIRRQKTQQKIDMKRFYNTKKYLVFYSEKSGYYKYFKGTIDYILENSKINIHYLTSDIDDQVFKITNPKLHTYYCGPHKLITVFMKLNCKVCITTMPDFDKYQFKRSIVNKNIKYIYMDHGLGSMTLQFRQHAFDAYDTIFCNGPSYNNEIRAMEKYYNTKEKTLINTGFTLYNNLLKSYIPKKNEQKTIVVAPSWQKDNIFESCLDSLMENLMKLDYKIVLRPHPEFIKKFPQKIQSIKLKYKNELQLDFSIDILDADIIITDWSSIAYEFSFVTNKPTLFVNTPMKVLNPDWDKYGIKPLELLLRKNIGVCIEINKLNEIENALKKLKEVKNPRAEIQKFMYDNKLADEIGGKYIIKECKSK